MRHRGALAVLFAATVAVLPRVGLAQTDPVAVFRQAIDARNRGDIVAMMALFTDDAVREDGLTIQGVPHLEGGHPGPIPVGDLEQVLLVEVRMDPAMEQFRRMFSAPGRLEQKQ